MAIRSVLVTGGAGYIGSHLVDRLIAREYDVTVLDNLEPQVHRSGTWPSYANPRATYVRGDVRDRAVLEPLVLASDAVVHFGAAVSIGQSMYQIDRYVDVNTRGTAVLLDILVNSKHHVQKVLLIGKTYGIPTVAPRFFNVYGPRQSLSNPYAGVAAIWLSRLLNDRQPVIFEDGGQLRDFVSIHDVVECLVLMLEKSGADYLPVNVGSGETVTILQIAEMLNRLLGTSIEPLVTQTGRKFDIRHNTADISRARETLGFTPTVTLEQGFSELIEWAKTTPD